MKNTLERVSSIMNHPEDHIRANIDHEDSPISFYGNSLSKKENAIITMARDHNQRFLMIFSAREDGVIAKFAGEQIGDTVFARKCPLNEHNAFVLRELFPWTAPMSLRKRQTTIGCGDRLGLATPGHIAAVRNFNASPVLAQQSMRELKLTGRTYRDVVDDTTFLVFQAGFRDGYGADGDHLKSISEINVALAAGMPMITLDLSEEMNADAGSWSDAEVAAAFDKLPADVRSRVDGEYSGRVFGVEDSSLAIDESTAKRCAVMYTRAVNFAAKVYEHMVSQRGEGNFDLEISIDETSSPTLPEHHLFITRELIHRGVQFSSLAPRFIGEFQKAIDYIGDVGEFARQFAVHCAIARSHGDYKISIHSGSDKFAVYPTIGAMTRMRCHVKTAGTSWLEAVRTIASHDPVLYRVLHAKALESLESALKLYHITADFSKIPSLDSVYDEDLVKLLDQNEARQLLHITYGAILDDHAIKPLLSSAMHKHEEYYHELIKAHFDKHLSLLGVPARS